MIFNSLLTARVRSFLSLHLLCPLATLQSPYRVRIRVSSTALPTKFHLNQQHWQSPNISLLHKTYSSSCYFGHILFAVPCRKPWNSRRFPDDFSYVALHILQLWQDVQAETVSLAAGSVSTVHEVSKSQNETKDLLHCLAGLEHLQRRSHKHTHLCETRSIGNWEAHQNKKTWKKWL